jgi:uncharacterized protein YceK
MLRELLTKNERESWGLPALPALKRMDPFNLNFETALLAFDTLW